MAEAAPRKKSLKRVFVRFAEKTTMQGVGYINSARLVVGKICWSVITVCALTAMVIHVWQVFQNYYTWPKQTVISLGYDNLELPAVTICNTNILKNSKVTTLPHGQALAKFLDMSDGETENFWKDFNDAGESLMDELDKLFEDGLGGGDEDSPWGPFNYQDESNETKDVDADYTNRTVDTEADDNNRTLGTESDDNNRTLAMEADDNNRTLAMDADDGFVNGTLLQEESSGYGISPDYNEDEMNETDPLGALVTYYAGSYQLLDDAVKAEKQFRALYADIPREERRAAGHNIKDMLMNCTFGGQTCYPENFTLHQTLDHGNCWTLSSTDLLIRDAGPEAGLSMTLYLEAHEFLNRLTHGFGMRVVIHPIDSLPIPKHEGLYVSAGFETDIALRKVVLTRLPEPYGDCFPRNFYYNYFGIEYTRQACLKLSEATDILLKCGCYWVDDEDVMPYLLNSLDQHICKNETEVLCSQEFHKEMLDRRQRYNCENPCRESVYTRQSSFQEWPSDLYVTALESIAGKKWEAAKMALKDMEKSDKRKNFLKLNIYYEDLNYEQIEEVPEISKATFLSDIGGAVGLWIGLSLMSIFEILHLLLELVDYGINKAMRHSEHVVTKKRQRRATMRKGIPKQRVPVRARVGDVIRRMLRRKGGVRDANQKNGTSSKFSALPREPNDLPV